MKKRILSITFLIIILLENLSFASYSTVTMSVVDKPVCTIQMSENSSFEKKLISEDMKNKEVTLQLQVSNNAQIEQPTGEIMLVIDNSKSMETETSTGDTRKNLVFESAKTLVKNLLKDNTKLKIGIVSFSTNTDIAKEGTNEDANLISELSNDATTLSTGITNIQTDGPRTNLQSGLMLASQKFTSENNNKYMIVLSDGVPNVAIGYDKIYYSDDVISKTKAQLESIEKSGIQIMTMLTGIDDESYVPAGVTKSFGEIIQAVFGTASKPTVGKFYYIKDEKIEETITDTIYKSLMPIAKTLKDITVTDYFPKEIIDNFDFAYVSEANIGTISAKIDTDTNSITWNMPELEAGKTATVKYKLKLKENFDSSIVDKIINTNQKVDINYTNEDGKTQTKTSDVTPKLKLTEPPVVLPKAGTTTLIVGVALISIIAVIFFVKIVILNNKMKN